MSPESLTTAAPEINFYGPDVDQMLKEDLKLITIRMPNPKYDVLIPGKPATAKCEGGNVDVRILSKISAPLRDIPDSILLLDGYLNPEEAAEDLKRYYKDVTVETPVLAIELISERSYRMFSPKVMKFMSEHSPAECVGSEICRPVYFPALAKWLSFRNYEKPGTEWFNFLFNEGLAEEYEIMGTAELPVRVTGHPEPMTLETFLNFPGVFADCLHDRTGELYRASILLENPD